MDLSELDPDQKVEHIETDAIQGTMNAFTKAQPDREWTVREVAEFCGLGTTSPTIVGTPEQVVDDLEHWHEAVGVDGFNVKEVVRPDSLTDFVDLVVPELREREARPDPDDAGDSPRRRRHPPRATSRDRSVSTPRRPPSEAVTERVSAPVLCRFHRFLTRQLCRPRHA